METPSARPDIPKIKITTDEENLVANNIELNQDEEIKKPNEEDTKELETKENLYENEIIKSRIFTIYEPSGNNNEIFNDEAEIDLNEEDEGEDEDEKKSHVDIKIFSSMVIFI